MCSAWNIDANIGRRKRMIEVITVLCIIASIAIVGSITILAYCIGDRIMEAITGISFTDALLDYYHKIKEVIMHE
jgi:hypothetical protein